MREAIGGTFLLKLVIIFLFIYISFMAIVLHYGKTFKIKNALINYIEQNEGISDITAFNNYSHSIGYEVGREPVVCYINTSRGYYYRVSVDVIFQLPLVDKDKWPTLAITGETRIIETGSVNPEKAGLDEC